MRAPRLLVLLALVSPLHAIEVPRTAQAMGLLKTNCLGCHNANKKKGGLSLETRELAVKGGEHGAAFLPGKAAQSRMIEQLAEGSDPHMPPKKQMPEKQVAILQAWIDSGAPWDDAALKSFGKTAEASQLGTLPTAPLAVVALALSPDGTKLASGENNVVVVRDVTKPERPIMAKLQGHKDVIQSVTWSPDGTKLAAGGYRSVIVWDAPTFTPNITFAAPLEGRVTAMVFLRDNSTLAIADGAAGMRGLIHLWPITSFNPIKTIPAHTDNILALAISHDGKMLASASADGTAKIWDTARQTEIAKLEGHTNHVTGVAFNQDGTWLATASADKDLKVWDIKAKEQIVQLGNKNTAFTAVHWSADGTRLIATAEDGVTRAYTELKTHDGVRYAADAGKETKLPGTEAGLYVVDSSSDGKTVYAGSDDGTVLAWSADGKQARLTPSEPTTSTPATKPLSFTNDILPILCKAGCDVGACHAKASGQAGLKLSVFAFDPKSDYNELVKDARGRRVFPALPEESLMLKKATVGIQHEGGQRFEVGSAPYNTIVAWIKQGARYEVPDEPKLTRIAVNPTEQRYAKNSSTQLKVTAHYTDGGTRDVTGLTDFASNEKGIATVNETGLVKAGAESGEAVIITRYLGQVAISRVAVPTDKTLPDAAYAKLPVINPIDGLVYARLKTLGHLPSETCTDAEFLRRSSLDATGTLPTIDEARSFTESTDPKKREKWIDHLLDSPAWADHWAIKWGDLIRPNPSRVGVKPVLLLDDWIRQSFRENKPWDQFVRELLTAQGGTHRYGPMAVWRDKREPVDAATFVGQIFLGVRLECAKCHHHPSEKWDMTDYYQMAAFFASLKHKGQGISAPISGEPEFIWSGGSNATIAHPVTNASLKPRPPAAAEIAIPDRTDPRVVLADWMTKPDNPLFARAVANRTWGAFFGRGIVDPVDDFRASNPPTNEPLLDWLAKDFVAHHYDLKHLMRTIMSSHIYQLSSLPNDTNIADLKNYSRSYRRRLPAEVLLDAVNDVTETSEDFTSTPQGSRATQTWNHKLTSEFMDAFGRPNASAECPCERDAKPSVVQALHLMNSTKLQGKLVEERGRVIRLAKSQQTPDQIVEELYLACFSRKPTSEESAIASKAIPAAGDKRQAAIEDVLWALLNSAEFVFNH